MSNPLDRYFRCPDCGRFYAGGFLLCEDCSRREAFLDDSGDDDLKDGGIGVPGYGFARGRDPMP